MPLKIHTHACKCAYAETEVCVSVSVCVSVCVQISSTHRILTKCSNLKKYFEAGAS